MTHARADGAPTPGSDASGASGASEVHTADDLLARLLHCDDQLAELLETSARAVRALAPETRADDAAHGAEADSFEAHTQHWLATLNDVQVTLREAARALREARLPPLTPPAAAHARLSGEAGVAGPTHALRAAVPWSWSTLQLRADAWRHVAASLRAAADAPSAESRALVEALGQGASVRSHSD
ncbi:ARF GAP with effector function(s) [Malassezia brasiliensis]|uniref:Mediator of RNA polymerase II transcription subunit 11 n=1 Tax=Malassezia brasiliensis TaxID=1821822 RepID=A0AAF0DWZ8_9BASI|nr:ARF GAP with effector function(s) [Malassezia brasiliensis]